MGTISVTQPADGTTIDAADVNDQVTTIVNEFNGSISADNLASNAVTTAKITDANVTTAKIANSNVTAAKVDSVYVTDTGTDGNVSAAGSSAWTDVTGCLVEVVTEVTSTIVVAVDMSCQNSSVQSSVDFSVTDGTATSTIAGQDIPIAGYLTEGSAVVILTGVTAGTKSLQLQFRSALETTFAVGGACRITVIGVQSEA